MNSSADAHRNKVTTMSEHDKTDNKSDTPDLSKLAGEYMDLWQKQLADMASDKDIATLMAQSIELMNTGTASMANMAARANAASNTSPEQDDTENGPNDDASSLSDTQPREQTSHTANHGGSSSSCPACGIANDAIDNLTQRIERLEKRLAGMATASDRGSR